MRQAGREFPNAKRVFGIWGVPVFFVTTIAVALAIERLFGWMTGREFLSPSMYVESWVLISFLSFVHSVGWIALVCAT